MIHRKDAKDAKKNESLDSPMAMGFLINFWQSVVIRGQFCFAIFASLR